MSSPPPDATFAARDLTSFATRVLAAAGLDHDHAAVTGWALVEADLFGFATHGLDLLPDYVDRIASGRMATHGAPSMRADGGATFMADGGLLPGPSVVRWCLDQAIDRARTNGVVTGLVHGSQHTGCHAVHLLRAVEQGLIVTIAATHSGGNAIAPFGGTTGVFAPPPLAVGIPTRADPILIDMTLATTAMRSVRQHQRQGRALLHPWLLTADGAPSNDPGALLSEPAGTILPLGGLDHGYKGFALLLYLEAMTSALTGAAGPRDLASATVIVQIVDPGAFGGLAAFRDRMSGWVTACLASAPRPGSAGVRIPGARALALRRQRLDLGMPLAAMVLERLHRAGAAAGVPLPGRLA